MGPKQKYEVRLTEKEKDLLLKNTKKGKWAPREVKRAQILLRVDRNNEDVKQGWEIAKELHCTHTTVKNIRRRFQEERIGIVHDKVRSGRPKIVDGDVEAHIIAIVCSEPPAGREGWTLRLIADKLVTLTELESCSYGTIRNALKKTNLTLGRKKNGKFPQKKMETSYGEWKKS